jgi:predicted P-loop ATPase
VAHPVRGLAERVWCYRGAQGEVLGYIYRFRTSEGGKEIVPLTWCRHEVTAKEDWRWISFPEPRPLYGLDRVAAKPDAWVLMTEGEKCADVADEVLPEFASASWPGGGKAIGKADFSSLTGRKVLLWPDADAQREKLTKDEEKAGVDPDSKPLLPLEKQPGWKTMIAIGETLVALGCEVEVICLPPPGEMAGGWDIADAVEEGTDAVALQAWIAERRRPWAEVTAPESSAAPDATSAGAGEEGDRPAKPTWWDWLLRKNGEIHPGLTNVYDCLLNFPEWKGVVAFDEFSQRTVKLKPPPYYGGEVGEWDSTDDSRTAMWLTRKLYSQVSSATVLEAVETLAKTNSFHPVRDWLNSLPPWDGVRRIDRWLHDYLNVPLTEYSRRVSAFFLRGMIARVMNPGCKFDYCLVLEGPQGKGKSTAVSILGGLWYGDTDLDLSNKDSMAALLGKWVYEFSEMGSVTRAEASKQKSFLSRQRDDFRPVYARRQITIPRQVVFVGTINEWEWNKDPTGGRRFWPVEVAGLLNLDGLREMREQLFAEALHDYRDGKRYWPTPDEQRELFDPEQLKREQGEGLVDALHDWVYKQVAAFSIADAVMSGLNMDASKLTRDMQTRVGIALRKLGCGRVEKRNGTIRYWYTPPVPSAVQESATGGQKTMIHTKEGEVRVPF